MPRGHVIDGREARPAPTSSSQSYRSATTRTIEERGANLSGGQRQRIAIARSLATQPRILIFDEATSALDYESERIIRDNMRQIVQGRTVIVIAHRLATLRRCDRLIGIEDGQIVEQGTHKSLLANPDSLYARLWRLQTEDDVT